jgi:hydrogenase maturation protein HypF
VLRWRLDVSGTVQAIGFRPHVWRLAVDLGLAGFVRNTPGGVTIEIEGPGPALDEFTRRLGAEAPPAARLAAVERTVLAARGAAEFRIDATRPGRAATMIPPDLAVCADCAAEIFAASPRRHRYPFTNCTRCGPRFTVVASLPYDRPATTLAGFPLCAACRREYGDPADRRFHAEPIACPDCGPRAWIEERDGSGHAPGGSFPLQEGKTDPILRAAALLCGGAVVAVHGLGGVHLACDATNEAAVLRLRGLKRRPRKPLAVMVGSLAEAAGLAVSNQAERALLASSVAPIVLLPRRADAPLAPSVAPGTDRLGIMLAYSPLHLLLLAAAGRPLVMTSANLPGEPLARSPAEARALFDGQLDAFLLHDRPIHQRCDDGVWMGAGPSGAQPVRLGRGSVPAALPLPVAAPLPLLAVGGDIKNAFCLADAEHAFLSQHVGSLLHAATRAHFRDSLEKWRRLTGIEPRAVAHDLHPASAGRALAAELGLPAVEVQHHHAHVAACLADNGRRGPVIGVALDGTGYGADGAVWGGEFLIADLGGYTRAGHLESLPLAGADAAVRHPARIAAAYLLATLGGVPVHALCAELGAERLRVLARMIERGVNTVPTSSCGRLFDAVAAILGLVLRSTYEGEAAVALEALARRGPDDGAAYPFTLDDPTPPPLASAPAGCAVVRLAPLLRAVTADVERGAPPAAIARRFHRSVIEIVVCQVTRIAAATGLRAVALSGGCFQNRLLLDGCVAALEREGLEILVHRRVPANDGGLALGQAAVAAARAAAGEDLPQRTRRFAEARGGP